MEKEIRNKILEIVHNRPSAIAEIAEKIKKNWRTVDRYVEQLVKEDIVKTHVFRKGGRGALKIAYWQTYIKDSPSSVKNFLLQRILNGVKREDFSAMDIVQHVAKEKRKITLFKESEYHAENNVRDFHNLISRAEDQILFFSGNLSFIDIGNKGREFIMETERKMKEGVNLFILTRVDFSDAKLIEALLQLNNKGYSGRIEIRYAHQPLRCTVVDEKIFYLKETFDDCDEDEESSAETCIYRINDSDWARWISNVFWHIWNGSINAENRLEILKAVY